MGLHVVQYSMTLEFFDGPLTIKRKAPLGLRCNVEPTIALEARL